MGKWVIKNFQIPETEQTPSTQHIAEEKWNEWETKQANREQTIRKNQEDGISIDLQYIREHSKLQKFLKKTTHTQNIGRANHIQRTKWNKY